MLRLVALLTLALASACGGKTATPGNTAPGGAPPAAPSDEACGGCPDGQTCDTCPGDPSCPECDVCGPPVCVER